MNFKFKFEYDDCYDIELLRNFWTGSAKAFLNGVQMKRLKEKGNPFQIDLRNGETKKMYIKLNGIDFAPKVVIDDKEILLAPKIKPYQYLIVGIPLILMFIGGAFGALFGVLGYQY